LFPRKCTYAKVIDLHNMVLWSIGFIANRYRIPPTKLACVRYWLWLIADAWSECRPCYTPTGSVHLVRRKRSCSLIIRTTTTNIPEVSVCGPRIFPNFCFFSHNFGSKYASKALKGSKDSDDSLQSKKFLNQKMAIWVVAYAEM